MIKTVKVSLASCNRGKSANIARFISEYNRVLACVVDRLWVYSKPPVLMNKAITVGIQTWLSARAIQACGKQASAIVRGTRRKQEQASFMINKLNCEGHFKQARKLEAFYAGKYVGRPTPMRAEIELDARFVKVDLAKHNSFGGWITLASLGNNIKIEIPFNVHSHLADIIRVGTLKGGIRLSPTHATLRFEIPDHEPIKVGSIVGVDIGQKTTLSVSDGQAIAKDYHGHTYQTICNKVARKRWGSSGFIKADAHRTNYLHWAVNQLKLDGVRCVNVEKLRGVKRGRRTSKSLYAWNYRKLLTILKGKLSEAGVQVQEVCPTYTSQRCSKCGWTRKGNRKLKKFKCDKCGFTHDADLNASINLSLELPAISKEQRLSQINRTGFYWLEAGREPIVPFVQKV